MCSRRDESPDSDPSTLSVVRQVNVPNVMLCWPRLPLVVETNVTLFFFFCQIQSNVTPCNSLYTKTPSPLTHTTSRPSLLYTHQCLRKESFCVLSLSFVYVLCCTSQPFCHRCTHKHTHTHKTTHLCYWAPELFLSHSLFFFFLFSPGRPGFMQRAVNSFSLRHRTLARSLSELFFLFVSKLLLSFRTSPVRKQRTTFPSTANLK